MGGKTADSTHWDSYWERKGADLSEWDYLSQVILQVLKDEIGDVRGKRIAEAGSGTGRISFRLAKGDAAITLVDYGIEALQLSRSMFAAQGSSGDYVLADIGDLPFRDGSFDVVWNAGVLEHNLYDRQGEILQSLIRLCKRGGIVITLNPNSKSPAYRLGKWMLERLKRWPFGEEYPIKSIRDVSYDQNLCLVREYPIGFVVSVVESYKFLPKRLGSARPFQYLSGFFVRNAHRLARIDRFLSRTVGGYLVVSVIRNESEL